MRKFFSNYQFSRKNKNYQFNIDEGSRSNDYFFYLYLQHFFSILFENVLSIFRNPCILVQATGTTSCSRILYLVQNYNQQRSNNTIILATSSNSSRRQQLNLFLNLIPPSIPLIPEISVHNSAIGSKEFQNDTDIVENQFAVGRSFISFNSVHQYHIFKLSPLCALCWKNCSLHPFLWTFVQTCCPIVPKREFKPVPYINVRTKEFSTFEYYTLEKLIIVDNSEKPATEQYVTILCSTEWKTGKNQDLPATMSLVTLWQSAQKILKEDSPIVVVCQ